MAVFTLPCQGNEAIGECISQIYSVSLTLVGIVAFVQIVWGGFLLLTAAGNTTKTGEAMNRIKNAVFGIVLLFSSYAILKTINPDLVKFNFALKKLDKEEKLANPNPNELNRIENFDVVPKFASWKDDTKLKFLIRIFGKTVDVEKLCPGQDVTMKQNVFLKKPPNTGTDSSVDIKIDSREFNKAIFGDGKVLSFDFEQSVKQGVLTDKAITFNANNSPFLEYYETLSCGNKELNRSAPVRINISW